MRIPVIESSEQDKILKFFEEFGTKIVSYNELLWSNNKEEKILIREKRLDLQKILITEIRKVFNYSINTADVDIIRSITKYKESKGL